MQHIADWYFSIIFFSGILGFVVAALLLFVNKTDTFSSRLLAGFLVCISLLAINYGLMVTTFYLRHPHLWKIFAWASFSYAPFAYLYVRSVLQQSFRLKKTDYLLFLPALLFTLNLMPFYFLPTAKKLEFVKLNIFDSKMISKEPEGMLPFGWGIWARILLGILTTIGQFVILNKSKNKIIEATPYSVQNVKTYKWLFTFTCTMAAFYLLLVVEFIFHFSSNSNYNYPVIFTISATIVFVCVSLLIRPAILYGITGWLQKPASSNFLTPLKIADTTVPINKNSFSIEQGKAYKKLLESHFSKNLPFRKIGYTIGDLSNELAIPSHQISAFINQEYGKNFNELINEYRVEYLNDLVQSSTNHLQFTLEALGKDAGFNTRAAFISAVKKETGKTPSEFFGRKG
jgi:AraC-like DNA-binding protein